MVMPAAASSHCIRSRMDNGIYRFLFTQSSVQAVDEYLGHLKELFDTHGSDQLIRALVDIRQSGMPPMRYAVRAGRNLLATYNPPPPMRVAFLHDAGVLVSVGEAFLNLIKQNSERRAFRGHQEREALAWLMQNSINI